MSCGATSKPASIEIEDLGDKGNESHKRSILLINESVEMVDNNYDHFKNAIFSLIDFFNQTHGKYPDELFKKKFNRKINILNKPKKNKYGTKLKNKDRVIVKKVYLIYAYQKMIANGDIELNDIFMHYIRKRPIRNMSGVNSYALLLPPYPMGGDDDFNGCKHNCYYCPNQTKKNGADVNIARSYLLKEPAVQRGFRNGWSAIRQMNDRMNSLAVQGHNVDKLELIIEGGTYTEYPMDFLEEYHRDIFYAANVFFDIPDENGDKRQPLTLQEEMDINITTKVRIIGICIETRPDAITDEWIRFFRNSGTTRIQLGVQHTNNRILKKINRGHTFEQSCEAVARLRDNCFKVDIHLMPDLPLSNPEEDKRMFETVFTTDVICPDQIKIYPCEVTPFTVIEKWHKNGKFTPYADKDPRQLIDVVKHALALCRPWIRIPRIIRDIPLEYIKGGNRYSNLRQMISDEMTKDGLTTMEIRSREIGRHLDYKLEDAKYSIRKYNTANGIEFFISLESRDKKAIFGFTRLRIPPINSLHTPVFKCLKNKGLIRELHVYNKLVTTQKKDNSTKKAQSSNQSNHVTQHRGTGKRLLQIAEWISWAYNMEGTAVITGEGVRGYYYKRGYHNEDTYAIKKFMTSFDMLIDVAILFSSFINGISFINGVFCIIMVCMYLVYLHYINRHRC
jgi:ELP3 family radical SAM enzyme/protein acetyltransferase